MKQYELTNEANQTFSIDTTKETLRFNIYWVQKVGWVVDLVGVAIGVRITLDSHIFSAYGRSDIAFTARNGSDEDITRDMLRNVMLVINDGSLNEEA